MWETWTGGRYTPDASWNHIMFGQFSDYTFKYLAGIRLLPGNRGWQNISISPLVGDPSTSPYFSQCPTPQVYANGRSICTNLSNVDASIVVPRGLIASSWTCGGPSNSERVLRICSLTP